MKKADIGLYGLAVMGENLVLNMVSKGFTVAVSSRRESSVKRFEEERGKDQANIILHTILKILFRHWKSRENNADDQSRQSR